MVTVSDILQLGICINKNVHVKVLVNVYAYTIVRLE